MSGDCLRLAVPQTRSPLLRRHLRGAIRLCLVRWRCVRRIRMVHALAWRPVGLWRPDGVSTRCLRHRMVCGGAVDLLRSWLVLCVVSVACAA